MNTILKTTNESWKNTLLPSTKIRKKILWTNYKHYNF